ncbi:hypothetical protein Dimus_004062 [Dionaea muscipula]
MATGVGNRLRELAAIAQSCHGKESSTITAQILKEKGKGKPENVQLAAIWGEGVRRKEDQKRKIEKEMEKLVLDKAIMEREVKEWKKKVKQMEGEGEMKKRKVDVEGQLKEKDEKIQELGLVAEQSEKVQLRAKIQAGRVTQQEMKEPLEEYMADVEGMSVQHYIKTEEFKASMARLKKL